MDIRRVLATEMRLLETICTFEDHGDYTLYRSSQFPNFYGGNGIEIHDPKGLSLSEWEGVFRIYFDPLRYRHTTFTFTREEVFQGLIDDAAETDYNTVELTSYMFVDHTNACADLPEEYEIRTVRSEEEWKRMHQFDDASYKEGDYYDPEYKGPDRLFEKKRVVTEKVGIEWFYLTRRGSDEFLAMVGVFEHQGICRLQDVETGKPHRRQKFASYLVSHAIRYAIDTLATEGLALCADSNYYAVDLYRKLGFVAVGDTVTLMKYPVKNPLFLPSQPDGDLTPDQQ